MTRMPAEIRMYLIVWVALLVLLALTVAVAYLDLGTFNIVATLAIAAAKAALIMLYFMHLRHSPKLNRVFALAAFLWLAILLAITMAEYLTRG